MIKSILKNLSFGYMPSFNNDLLTEIDFTKSHFSFIEATLKYDLEEYTEEYLAKIKKALNSLELMGHTHWEIDLTKIDIEKEIDRIAKNIEIYKFLGARQITIHPSHNKKISVEEIKKRNIYALNRINNLCSAQSIEMLIENGISSPFCSAEDFIWLLKKIPSAQMTLDIGHANLVSQTERKKIIEALPSKIRHIHLHHKIGKFDHLPFDNSTELVNILEELNKLNKQLTISLEIFYNLKSGQRVPIEEKERKEIILNQLKLVKNI